MAKCRLTDDRQNVCMPCNETSSNTVTFRAQRDNPFKFNFLSVCGCSCVLVTAKCRLGNYERQHRQVIVTYRMLR